MAETRPPPEAVRRAGYETRDADPVLVVLVAVTFAVLGAVLLTILWGTYRDLLPEAGDGANPPVVMPGEAPVNDRIGAIPSPRLEGLNRDRAAPEFHPEDLRAGRQPRLNGYGWVDRDKGIARIPIDRAMDAVAESARAKPTPKKGGTP
jgi:hypothetical protein